MQLHLALSLLRIEMRWHPQLADWKAESMRNKRVLGMCQHHSKTIFLSEAYVEQNDEEEVMQTIYHEIAHALCTYEDGHSAVWLNTARALGYTGSARTDSGTINMTYLWEGTCAAGHKQGGYHRRPKKLMRSCGECSSFFDFRYLLTWTNTKTGETLTARAKYASLEV